MLTTTLLLNTIPTMPVTSLLHPLCHPQAKIHWQFQLDQRQGLGWDALRRMGCSWSQRVKGGGPGQNHSRDEGGPARDCDEDGGQGSVRDHGVGE